MSFIVRFDNFKAGGTLGGKGRALAALSAAAFPVPPWLVVVPEAFAASATEAQRAEVSSQREHFDVLGALSDLQPAPALRDELDAELTAMSGAGQLFAVRSSAVEEDSVRHSFAGQLRSFLFVPASQVADRVVDVWRSGFGERVYAYRREHGLSGPPGAPAVVIQQMVNADASGVAFSADPVSGNREIAVVASVYGMGTALVDGDVDADTHHVDANGKIVTRSIARKTIAHRADADAVEGVKAVDVDPDSVEKPVLRESDITAVADLARRTEQFSGRPQDIEWAIEGGTLFLLQSRPITSLFDLPEENGFLNIWDNSNIAESYGGITTPLTFTFARNAYENVYRQLCKTFQVPRGRIVDNATVFANMLGMIRGRVYYNLLNWYRFLAMLPGYQANRGFMEQMMGVKESLPEGVLDTSGRPGLTARVVDGIRFTGTVVGFSSKYFTLRRSVDRFYRRLDEALDARGQDPSSMRADELVSAYRSLESRLLTRWDAPLINDFYTMIFYGVLRKQCAAWCGDETGTLQNDLLCESGGMVSTEPAKRLQKMAKVAQGDPELVDALCNADSDEVIALIAGNEELRQQYDAYLEKFGERCFDELKLESPTLHDDPLMLLRSIGRLAKLQHATADSPRHSPSQDSVREAAESRVASALASSPIRRRVFQWVLNNARERVRDRENLRLERTRLFGRVRRIFVGLGQRFYERDLLDDAHDIFYLHVDEILGFVEGTATSTNLRKLAALRKEEFEGFATLDPPADRFETRGVVYVGNKFRAKAAPSQALGEELAGIGCCPGRVSGPVRVVHDPRGAELQEGDILVAERTDPSWVLLFPFASGLLVERGSLLSHSAIVAREMGIPAIVSLEGVTRWLNDGDWVEMDGSEGVVRKIPAGSGETP